VDLVGNDTGGAVAQIFAVRHPDRIRSFTLTNCDCEGNFPPPEFAPVVEVDGAKVFFPEERRGDLVPHLRRHWGR
jgi:pimeloyl-ACP methyl ester carboxylesterase